MLAALTAPSDGSASSLRRVNGYDLFGFLERLDGEAPSGKEMVALIGHRAMAQREAADWADGHSGWSCLPLTHREWGEQVERLLNRCTWDSSEHICGVLKLIEERELFVWIKTDQGPLK